MNIKQVEEVELTDEQRARSAEVRRQLDALAAERKARLEGGGPALPPEQAESVAPSGPSRVLNIAEVMPEMIAAMERQKNKWAAFCASLRPQFEALPESKACKEHPLILRPKLFEETCQKSRLAGEFKPAWAPCRECQRAEARARQRAFWAKRGVPGRVLEATLANFRTDTEARVRALARVTAWIRRHGVFLLLTGTAGTGKGHLAAGCLKAQGNGLFITHADMLADLRASYTLETTPALIASWREAELLVIDEFGLSSGGRDEEPMLYQVLSARYEHRRPTIITSNLEVPALREAVGFRLLDRMREDCVMVVCRWASWRTGR